MIGKCLHKDKDIYVEIITDVLCHFGSLNAFGTHFVDTLLELLKLLEYLKLK